MFVYKTQRNSFVFDRKRKASKSKSRSPSVKKARDGSPTLSTHSKKSIREPAQETETPMADTEKHSEKVSKAFFCLVAKVKCR